jgi:hypothetical protein
MLAELLAAADGNDKQWPTMTRLFKAGFALLIIALVGSVTVGLTG